MHRLKRFNCNRIVEQNPSTTIQLEVDKPGRKIRVLQINDINVRIHGKIALGENRLNPVSPNNYSLASRRAFTIYQDRISQRETSWSFGIGHLAIQLLIDGMRSHRRSI